MKRPLKALIDIASCSNSTNPGSECKTECSQDGFQNDAIACLVGLIFLSETAINTHFKIFLSFMKTLPVKLQWYVLVDQQRLG